MSFVPLYGLNTTLTAATASGAGQLKIDNNEAMTIATQLGAGFTYVSLSDGVNFEIVRIDSVTAPFLNVTRAQDGTPTSAFPEGACIRFIWNAEGISAIAAGVTFTVTGIGAAVVTSTGTNSWQVNVPIPVITSGGLPIEVMGAYPSTEIAFQGTFGGCCCGGGGGSGGTITLLTGSGIATVTGGSGPTANVSVLAPNFIAGSNMSISGTWPNITFAASGGGGGGGVSSVTGSTKILISGSLSNPVVNLVTTGVGAGTYNGISYDNWGCITAVNSGYVPITSVTSSSSEIVVTPSGPGAVVLSFSGSGTFVGVSSGYSAASSGSYTTAVSGVAVTLPILALGQTAVITASASVVDSSTPTLPPSWGLAIFDSPGGSLIQGVEAIPTGTHSIQYSLVGPTGSSDTLVLKTTALSGTMSVVAKALSIIVYRT